MYIQLVQLIKNDNGFFTGVNSLEDYLNKPGVWAMKGKAAETSQYEYLEIGQANDIGSELKCDLKLLMSDYSTANLVKEYTERRLFPEYQEPFNVCKCDKDRTAAKYRTIANLYNEIIIELISTDTCRSMREEIEYRFAIDHNAKYWNAWGPQRRKARKYYNKRCNDILMTMSGLRD